MSDCNYQQMDDGRWNCIRCNVPTKRAYPKPPRKMCSKRGIGDHVANVLAAVGVTKRRYYVAMVYLRLKKPGTPCNCPQRQEKLNRIGDGVIGWLKSIRLPS